MVRRLGQTTGADDWCNCERPFFLATRHMNSPSMKPRYDRAGNPVPRRSGFTLIEMVLVVAILVGVAAIVVPMATQTVESNRLRASADRVRGAFAECRNNAIRSGNEYAFYCMPNYRTFFISRFDPLVRTQLPAIPDEEMFMDGSSDTRRNFLEVGCKFAGEEISSDSRSQQIGGMDSDVSGYQRILFYPDGTCQASRIYLMNDLGDVMKVELRGLTGTTSVSDFLSPEAVR